MHSKSAASLLGLLLAVSMAPAHRAQSIKLNGQLQQYSLGELSDGIVSPDGRWLVYKLKPWGVSGLDQVHSVPLDGSSPPIVLSLPEFGSILPFKVTADSQRVVYRVGYGFNWALVSSPIAGGTLPTLLKQAQRVEDFWLSPDGTRAVVLADATGLIVSDLYSVPVDRSSRPVKLNPPLVPGGDIRTAVISPDGQWVAYVADQDVHYVRGVYGVPIDGSQPARNLSASVQPFQSPTLEFGRGNRIVFSRDLGTSELFSCPVDGSQPLVDLNTTGLVHVTGFHVSPDGAHVLFVATNSRYSLRGELFQAPVDGGQAVFLSGGVLLSAQPSSPTGEPRPNYVVDPVSGRVVYLVDQSGKTELFSVPIDASSPPLRLNEPLSSAGDVMRFQLSPSTGRVVYWLVDPPRTAIESVPADGSAPPVRLRRMWFSQSLRVDFDITSDGLRVVLNHHEPPWHLYSVAIDGSAPSIRLTPDVLEGGEIQGPTSLSNGLVAFGANADIPNGFEIYTVPSDGSAPPTRRSADLELYTSGAVTGFQPDLDGRQVVFRAGLRNSNGLHVVPTDGHLPPRRIAAGVIGDWVYAPSQGRVAFAGFENRILYGAALGGGPPIELSHRRINQLTLAPGGARALFRTGETLWSVPLDGSSSEVQLSRGVNLTSSRFYFTPQGTRVLYNDENELYSRPVDGSQPSVLLGPTSGFDLTEVSPDGERVLFNSSPPGMFSAPVSGASPTILLLTRGPVRFPHFSSDSSRTYYVDDFTVASQDELYTLPVDGSGAPVRIGPSMPAAGDVTLLKLDAGRTHAYYLADQDVDEVVELYRVSTAGGPSTKLSGVMPASGDVLDFLIVGSRVVYRADPGTDEVIEIYSTPADGSGAPTRLNPPLVSGGDVSDFRIDADERFVVYRADADLDGVQSLYVVPIDGSAPARRLHPPPPVDGGDVTEWSLQDHPPRAVFIGDLDEDNIFELYSSLLGSRILPK